MAKITLRVKAILVIVTFLGFTNLILSENRATFSELILTKILPEKVSSLLTSEAMPPADAPVKQRAKIRQVSTFESNGIKSSLKSALNPVITIGAITPASCSGNSDGAINISVSEGTQPYTYSWTGPESYTSDQQNLTGLKAGTYNLIVTDNTGATATTSETIVQPEPLTMATPTSTPVSCNAGNDGTATAGTVSGGNAGYQYKLDSGTYQASNSFSGLTAGNYTITVKDSKGCETSQAVIVTQPGVLTMAMPTFTPVSCNAGNDGTAIAGAVSGGNAGYQYKLDSGTYGASNSFSGLTAGTYTITVQDEKGCETSQAVIVTQPGVLTMAMPTFTPVSCNAGNDGTAIAGTVSGGNAGYQYKLDSGTYGASNSFSGLTAGTYTITVQDAKGCETSQAVIVTQPGVLTMTNPTFTPVSCNAGNDGTTTAGTVSGGNAGYQYKLDSGTYGTSNSFSGLTAGTYTITVQDAKGCETSQAVTVTQPGVLTMTNPTFTPVSCNAGNDGTTTAGTVSGGNAGYQYKLDSGTYGASNSFSGLTAGTYTITVQDAKGCETSQAVTVTQPGVLTMQTGTFTPISCKGQKDGSLTAGAVTGGNTNYEYSVDGTTFQTSNIFNNLFSGLYTIRVRDNKGCITSNQITITEPDELVMATPTTTNVSCFGGSDGTLTAGAVTGGNGTYQYSLDNANFNSSPLFTGLAKGTYTIFVKNEKNCSLQVSATITEPAVLTATVSKTDVSCFGGSNGKISMTNPTGGHSSYEYSINGTAWQSQPTFENLSSATFQVFMRDANYPNCIVTLKDNYIINQPSEALAATVTTTRTTTYGTFTGTAIANALGGTSPYTYEWRKVNESTVLQTTKTATNLASGNYTLTVKDVNGCSFVEEFTIIDAIEAFIVSRSICESIEGASDMRTSYFEVENLTAVGGVAPYTYEWNFGSDADAPISRTGSGEHKVNYSSVGNKTITLTITDSTGNQLSVSQSLYVGKCYEPCGKSENIVFDPNNFYIGDINGTEIDLLTSCDNTQDKYVYLKVDKSANAYNPYIELVYLISNDLNGKSIPYFVNGCRDGDDINDDPTDNQSNKIGEYIRFTIDPIEYVCGDNFNIDNFYITWTNVSKKDCGQNNNAFCYSIDDPIVLPTALLAEATPNQILCKGDNSGIINVKVSGGFAPYSYSLTNNSNYQNNSQFINLFAGNYIIYVKDSRGNTTQVSANISEPDLKVTATTSSIEPLCFGEMGEATVTGNGGTAPYTYLWNDSDEQTTVTAIGLLAGNYTVTVIDANGCQAIETVIIAQPEELTLAQTGQDQSLNCGFNSTILEANITDVGTGKWTIESGTGGSITSPLDWNSEFTGTSGTYVLRWTISDTAANCSNYDEMSITFSQDCSTLDFDGINDHITMGDSYGLATGSYSIETWVKLNSTTGIKTILSKRNASNLSAGGFDLNINNGAPTFRWNGKSISTSNKLTTERWYHLAVTFANSTISFYVDGILMGTNASAGNPLDITEPFLIGAIYNENTSSTPKDYFHGWIEEVRIWKTALTEEQLHFMMNQRLIVGNSPVRGTILPLDVPGNLNWNDLSGYYQLIANEINAGYTPDKSANKFDGLLKNIETTQQNTAPLPYISAQDLTWANKQTWLRPDVWDYPNSKGIDGTFIDWNIAQISNKIPSGAKDITLLGLLSESNRLSILNPNETANENNSGQGLTITHYLKLNGSIDLVGESQLIQTEGSVLDESSSGYLERDQQGTANSYNYNYWSSPVSLQGAANNSTYTIGSVMLDGTNSAAITHPNLNFGDWHEHADGAYGSPQKISNYWLHKFRGTANVYSEWEHIGSTGSLNAGEGYTMKGTSGQAAIEARQNYVFKGKPNNGTIPLTIQQNQNYLLGNPYPSSIDINKFILDNLNSADVTGGTNNANIFNGAVYFWDHFAGGDTHILLEYIGGYATRNLIDGVPAISNDYRINANDAKGTKIPGQFIPVAQGFFINSVIDPEIAGDVSVDGGDVLFKNSQRVFVRESSGNTGNSIFLRPEEHTKKAQKTDTRAKIRLDFISPQGYQRQILVGVDSNTTNGVDLGYDAPINDYNSEDMFWLIGNGQFVIQGVPDFNLKRVLPLGIRIAEQGELSIKINKLENISEEVHIYLKDNTDSTYHDLRESNFNLNLEKGEIMDRFEIVFQKEKDKDPEPDPDPIEEPNTDFPETLPPGIIEVIFAENEHQLKILNPYEMNIEQVEIYNMLGQQVESFTSKSNKKEMIVPVRKHPAAIYVVKISAIEGKVSKNILLMR